MCKAQSLLEAKANVGQHLLVVIQADNYLWIYKKTRKYL